MKTVRITCDGCGEELTASQKSRYCLTLELEYILAADAAELRSYDKPLDRAHQFCNLHCLDRWRQEKS